MFLQKSSLKLTVTLLTATFFAASCSKDSFNTKPSLSFIKASSYDVARGAIFEFDLKFTDKEGDIGDSLFIKSFNKSCPASNQTLRYPIPTIPQKANLEGEINVRFVNNVLVNGYATWTGNRCNRNDTTIFSFWIKDKEKNVSDTVTLTKEVIIRNN